MSKISEQGQRLLDRLPYIYGDPVETWYNREKAKRLDRELGELDQWAQQYGVKRGGYLPSGESMHGSEARRHNWLAAREDDEPLRERVRKAILLAHRV